ncbi:hypothetical protein HBE96_22385 [Clostridium sp. P21]|uniref:Uncharacterized protein n=1 Tax=Clostridium muellerianum TaxID=2716538 RepID=A0A7Y0EKU3_9CLOT|nr:hypothetical protein [Clostridium muellerianum]NMM65329.1 hypothetical protein [Clostridium muellerianum]
MNFFKNKDYFSTGILTRKEATSYVRISLVNLGENTEFVDYKVYNWNDEIPFVIESKVVQLDSYESKINDVNIVSMCYGDRLDANLYEVRLSLIHNKSVIASICEIGNSKVYNEGNTIFHSQLNPIKYR